MNTEAPDATATSPRRSFALVALLVAIATFVRVWSCGSSSSITSRSVDALQFVDDGMPFGEITEGDIDRLMKFAQEQGYDLNSDFQQAYAKDASALGRIFRFSLKFKSLDQNARTYGQTLYSSLLNLGETMGLEWYAAVVAAQSPEVQQRIGDFIYFAVTLVPKTERAQAEKQAREALPTLFPKDYRLGHDNPLFKLKAILQNATRKNVSWRHVDRAKH
jgi:hypothetical protein